MTADLVSQLRFLRRTAKFKYAKDELYIVGEVMHNAADEIERLDADAACERAEKESLKIQVLYLMRALHAKQAKIDALMLEFCPGEMSKEQRDEWAEHQRPADDVSGCAVCGEPTLTDRKYCSEICESDATPR